MIVDDPVVVPFKRFSVEVGNRFVSLNRVDRPMKYLNWLDVVSEIPVDSQLFENYSVIQTGGGYEISPDIVLDFALLAGITENALRLGIAIGGTFLF